MVRVSVLRDIVTPQVDVALAAGNGENMVRTNTARSVGGSFDGAVSGLSKKPDQTWAEGATPMTASAAALGTEASDVNAAGQ